MIGTIVTVDDDRLGAEMTAADGIGATTLHLDDTDDFEEAGGFVLVGALVYAYDAVDDDALTIHLTSALTVGTQITDWIAPCTAGGTAALKRVAGVDVGAGDAMQVVVPHALQLLLPVGARGLPGTGGGDLPGADVSLLGRAGEVVRLKENRNGEWEIAQVLGTRAGLVGGSLDIPDVGRPGFHVGSDGSFSAGGTDETNGPFAVDPAGDVVVKSLVVDPKDTTTVPLTVRADTGYVGPNLTEWQDAFGVILAKIRASGVFETTKNIVVRTLITDANGVFGWDNATLRLFWGAGGATPADVNLFRNAADVLKTDDSLIVAVDLEVDGTLYFDSGHDTNLHRSAANVLKTDDSLIVAGNLEVDDYEDIVTRGTAAGAPAAGRLRLYVTNDGSGHPQLRVKNSAGTTQTLTTFADGA